jgi:hypothetical protein
MILEIIELIIEVTLSFIIPIALAVLGWRFVYREGNRLAKRNETYNLFQIGQKSLGKIDEESEKIWASTELVLSELDSAKLLAFLAEFERCMLQLRKNYCEPNVSSRQIFSLRRALTVSPFPMRGKNASNIERIKEIKQLVSGISADLLDSVFDNMNNTFK